MAEKTDLLKGTLDLLVLRILAHNELHGWGITQRLERLSGRALRVDEGSLYPALYRMEAKGWLRAEWRLSEKGRRAKYYSLTPAGRIQLESEQQSWKRMTGIIGQVLRSA